MASLDYFPKALRMAPVLGAPAYSLARLYFMAEAVRTSFYLPPGAFSTTWSAGIPHVVEDDSGSAGPLSNTSKS